MLNIKKILLPLDLQETVLPAVVIRQAAALAHRFQAEIILLHVVKPLTYMADSETARQHLETAVALEQENLTKCLGSQLDGLSVRYLVFKGDPAREIARTSQDENIDLIVMPSHGYGAVERFLIGSVTAKVLHNTKCPVWTGAHMEAAPGQPLEIHNVLCAIDFGLLSPKTARFARDVATAFGAQLTLAHVTPGVGIYGPGGYHVLTEMKQELVSGATKRMDEIQKELGTKAEVFIGCGDVAKVISQAAKETKADLIVVGARSHGGRFGTTSYGIIRESHLPVLNI
jgi:nucleotide-binding universal stress UspA family protein